MNAIEMEQWLISKGAVPVPEEFKGHPARHPTGLTGRNCGVAGDQVWGTRSQPSPRSGED